MPTDTDTHATIVFERFRTGSTERAGGQTSPEGVECYGTNLKSIYGADLCGQLEGIAVLPSWHFGS